MVAHALTLAPDDAQSWLAGLEGTYSDEQRKTLGRALEWLAEHGSEIRVDTGAALHGHALGTAAVLAGMRFDVDTVAAALLAGLPEEALARDKLTKSFGAPLAALVEGDRKSVV
jgi:(p)ppGpp synthase/HD superfamily hydrolase